MSKIYRIVPLGPTGSGKSQLCNFIYKDKSNNKFLVSNALYSQTKIPQAEFFTRKVNDENINIELIDTAGCSDSGGNDEEYFKDLINKLREKKSIDLFILVFNFTTRIDGTTKKYMKLIANTFTPTEFFNHLAIVFTRYPEEPEEEDINDKETKTSQVIDVIKDSIGLANGETTFAPTIYELDTRKKKGNFIEKFQATIDLILIKMQIMINLYGPVNTENIKFCGIKDRLKEEQEKLEKQKLENERIQKENEDNRRLLEENRKKLEDLKKKQEEDDKLNKQRNEEEKKKLKAEQENLRKKIKQQEEEDKKRKEDNKKKEEQINKKLKELQEKITKFDIRIRTLDELIKVEEKKMKGGIISIFAGVGACLIPFGFIIGIPAIIAGSVVAKKAQEEINQLSKRKKKEEEDKNKINKQ